MKLSTNQLFKIGTFVVIVLSSALAGGLIPPELIPWASTLVGVAGAMGLNVSKKD